MSVTIEEKLKTVAEFMGYTERPEVSLSEKFIWFQNENGNGKYLPNFTYNTDYNELMGVWVKFTTSMIAADERNETFEKHCTDIGSLILYAPKIVAFDAIYSAILFLNSLKETK